MAVLGPIHVIGAPVDVIGAPLGDLGSEAREPEGDFRDCGFLGV